MRFLVLAKSSRLLRAVLFCCAWFLIGACGLISGGKPARISPNEVSQPYDEAKKALQKKQYYKSAALAWWFLKNHTTADKNYENAEFIMAKSLDSIRLFMPAVEYYFEVVRHGAAKELITESLSALFRIIENEPYDYHLIEQELIANAEFEFFSGDFDEKIKYIQGKENYLREDKPWADKKFEQLDEAEVSALKVRFAKALERLSDDNADEIVEEMDAIIKLSPSRSDILNKTIKAKARLLYERKDYKGSLEAYETLSSSVLTWRDVFLEKAWNAYWLYDYSKALGYLHALKAPHFQGMYQPEKYLLQSVVLRNLCQYPHVRESIYAFRSAYSDTIDQIREGLALDEIASLKQAALSHPKIFPLHQLLQQMRKEADTIKSKAPDYWLSSGLVEHLKKIYNLKAKELEAEIASLNDEVLKEVSEDLIHYNEQLNVLEYETRMDEFRRASFSDPKPPIDFPQKKVLNSDVIHWKFDQEYWIDELNHYQVNLESVCDF